MKNEQLPYRTVTEPVPAYKTAWIQFNTLRGFQFQGVASRHPYDTIDTALCKIDTDSSPPHLSPPNTYRHNCGFYACKTLGELYDQVGKSYGSFTYGVWNLFQLTVQLSGKIIVCKKGYRASQQKVTAIIAPTFCSSLGCRNPTELFLFEVPPQLNELYVSNRDFSILSPSCLDHVPDSKLTTILAISPKALASKLGAEVTIPKIKMYEYS